MTVQRPNPTTEAGFGRPALKHIWRELVNAAVRQGWTFGRRTKHGQQLISPAGDVIMLSGSPGSQRSYRNAKADLRRAGLRWPV